MTGRESAWSLFAVADLFVLVVVTCCILARHFNARDARNRLVWQSFETARAAFMQAAENYQSRRVADLAAAIAELIMLGDASLKAFGRARVLFPEAEPDADWTNTLLWAQSKARLFGIV
jgi:hypothetical protein